MLYFRYYDEDLALDDEETRKLLENVEKIKEKEGQLKMVK